MTAADLLRRLNNAGCIAWEDMPAELLTEARAWFAPTKCDCTTCSHRFAYCSPYPDRHAFLDGEAAECPDFTPATEPE